ncbi:hypothetical protein E2C01_040739 [Portunus trituberculatus]|uniref:Uncharacterized protein n=1 Tax=Portunus trituberculatus TaxID=210409 RepID=A0A5B7FNF0_PORTR|nr:hypothetical protein [Portunus trituberculatus]
MNLSLMSRFIAAPVKRGGRGKGGGVERKIRSGMSFGQSIKLSSDGSFYVGAPAGTGQYPTLGSRSVPSPTITRYRLLCGVIRLYE